MGQVCNYLLGPVEEKLPTPTRLLLLVSIHRPEAFIPTLPLDRWATRDLILGDDALSTKPVMHYQGTAYLCY